MGFHLTPSYKPNRIPSTSPIDKNKAKEDITDGSYRRLVKAEDNLFKSSDHRISITSQISHGDAILSIAGSITSIEELIVTVKYLVRFAHLPLCDTPELYVVEAALEQLKDRLINRIDEVGGVDFIIHKNLERTFPNHDTPVSDEEGDFTEECDEEGDFIEECLKVVNQVKSVDKAIKYVARMRKEV